jgi:hypothetical protein
MKKNSTTFKFFDWSVDFVIVLDLDCVRCRFWMRSRLFQYCSTHFIVNNFNLLCIHEFSFLLKTTTRVTVQYMHTYICFHGLIYFKHNCKNAALTCFFYFCKMGSFEYLHASTNIFCVYIYLFFKTQCLFCGFIILSKENTIFSKKFR